MKEFIKIQHSIIRTSFIDQIDCDDDELTIKVIYSRKESTYYYDKNENAYRHDKAVLESILLDIALPAEAKRPDDYELVLNFCKSVWLYYGRGKGADLTAQQIRKAIWHIEDINYGKHHIPDIYNKVAVEYGILSKLTTQRFLLNVD